MKRLIAAAFTVAALLVPAASAGAAQGELPAAACNQGTEHAHSAIPESAPGHAWVPELVGSDCTHEGTAS